MTCLIALGWVLCNSYWMSLQVFHLGNFFFFFFFLLIITAVTVVEKWNIHFTKHANCDDPMYDFKEGNILSFLLLCVLGINTRSALFSSTESVDVLDVSQCFPSKGLMTLIHLEFFIYALQKYQDP